jgi:hypothetical protein
MWLRISALAVLLALPGSAQIVGAIDLHVHSAPDSGPRSIDAFEVARLARRYQMRALLFKNHYTQTASLAYLVGQQTPEIECYGGIVLNRAVGGLNPVAIERMAMMSGGAGKVVWMPTFDSEHYHRVFQANPQYVPIAADGKLLAATLAVLDTIAEHELALATGHSSPAESLLLIAAARQRGIDRIIVTHPLPKPVGMSVADQKKAAAMGAFLEYPYGATLPPNPDWPGGHNTIEDYIAAIRAVGPEHVILSSDLGQRGNPVHTDGLIGFVTKLVAAGFSQAELDRMMKSNPARLLGLE